MRVHVGLYLSALYSTIYSTMDNVITANELKTRGVSRLDEVTAESGEAGISVHGKRKYVVLSVEEYAYLRECELEAALAESRRDLEAGNVIVESVEDHIKRITSA